MDMTKPLISVSVVSHGQMALVLQLLQDLTSHCQQTDIELILTLNVGEQPCFDFSTLPYAVKLIRNPVPLGFGANHNQAFAQASGGYFCVVNPDIRMDGNPFCALLACLDDPVVGVAAPLVLGPDGRIEDSARHFPNPVKIMHKFFKRNHDLEYAISDASLYPDWVGGMFMLFRREIFERVAGFDERYFLYYEDVDLCARLKLLGYRALLCPQAKVVHHAQRSSHANFKYLRWHLRSMMRFFLSSVYWRLCWPSRL